MYKNTLKQGDAGFGIAIGWFAAKGYTVCVPLTDSQPYDLVVERCGIFQTVQVKTTTHKERKHFSVQLCVKGGNKSSVQRTRLFDAADADWLFIVTGDNDLYVIPSDSITNKYSMSLNSKWNMYRVQAAKLESRTSL